MKMLDNVSIEVEIDQAGICYQIAEVLEDISIEFRVASQHMEKLGVKYCKEKDEVEPEVELEN